MTTVKANNRTPPCRPLQVARQSQRCPDFWPLSGFIWLNSELCTHVPSHRARLGPGLLGEALSLGGLVVGFGMPFSFAAGISFLKDHGRPPRKPLYVKDTLLFLDGLMCEDTSAPIRSMFALGMFKVWGVAFPLYLGNPRSSDHSWVWNGCAFPLGLLDKAGQESFPQVLFLSDRQFNMRVENGDREMSSEFLMWYLQVESVK